MAKWVALLTDKYIEYIRESLVEGDKDHAKCLMDEWLRNFVTATAINDGSYNLPNQAQKMLDSGLLTQIIPIGGGSV